MNFRGHQLFFSLQYLLQSLTQFHSGNSFYFLYFKGLGLYHQDKQQMLCTISKKTAIQWRSKKNLFLAYI